MVTVSQALILLNKNVGFILTRERAALIQKLIMGLDDRIRTLEAANQKLLRELEAHVAMMEREAAERKRINTFVQVDTVSIDKAIENPQWAQALATELTRSLEPEPLDSLGERFINLFRRRPR